MVRGVPVPPLLDLGTEPPLFGTRVKNLLSSAVVNRGDLRGLNYNKTIFGRGSNWMKIPSHLHVYLILNWYPHFLDQSYAPCENAEKCKAVVEACMQAEGVTGMETKLWRKRGFLHKLEASSFLVIIINEPDQTEVVWDKIWRLSVRDSWEPYSSQWFANSSNSPKLLMLIITLMAWVRTRFHYITHTLSGITIILRFPIPILWKYDI